LAACSENPEAEEYRSRNTPHNKGYLISFTSTPLWFKLELSGID
jgi:hypothetical protein